MIARSARGIVSCATLALVGCGASRGDLLRARAGVDAGADSGSEMAPRPFPEGAGVVDVKDAYGARGDCRADDTEALVRAVRDNVGRRAILYLPDGVYCVRDRIDWRRSTGEAESALSLIGQSESGTIIRLVPSAPGFADPVAPRAVLRTSSRWLPGENPDVNASGAGNRGRGNFVERLTIEVGAGNPGAIGLDFLATDRAAVRDVTIRSLDPERRGVAGLAMTRQWPGPLLVQRVTVVGFEHGVETAVYESGMTVEHLTLRDQRAAGVVVRDNALALRGLASSNRVPAVRNLTAAGLVTLVDATLLGGDPAVSAIENAGAFYARNVRTEGDGATVSHAAGGAIPVRVTDNPLSEWSSKAPSMLFAAQSPALQLLVLETPRAADKDLGAWTPVANQDGDDTAALQRALDAGTTTVYLPAGAYTVSDTLRVPAGVRHIHGFDSTLDAVGPAFADAAAARPVFRVEGATTDSLVIERILVGTSGTEPGARLFEHASSRPLVLRDLELYCPTGCYAAAKDAAVIGDVFIENVHGGPWQFDRQQRVWARSLNAESAFDQVVNTSAKLWALGLQGEGGKSLLEAGPGSETEVLGGWQYVRSPPIEPIFVLNDAHAFISFAAASHTGFSTVLEETRGGETRRIEQRTVSRGSGAMLPVFLAQPPR